MEPKINQELKTFKPQYICSHELRNFVDSVLGKMGPLDNDHKAYEITGLIETVYRMGIKEGVNKAIRRMMLVLLNGTEWPYVDLDNGTTQAAKPNKTIVRDGMS